MTTRLATRFTDLVGIRLPVCRPAWAGSPVRDWPPPLAPPAGWKPGRGDDDRRSSCAPRCAASPRTDRCAVLAQPPAGSTGPRRSPRRRDRHGRPARLVRRSPGQRHGRPAPRRRPAGHADGRGPPARREDAGAGGRRGDRAGRRGRRAHRWCADEPAAARRRRCRRLVDPGARRRRVPRRSRPRRRPRVRRRRCRHGHTVPRHGGEPGRPGGRGLATWTPDWATRSSRARSTALRSGCCARGRSNASCDRAGSPRSPGGRGDDGVRPRHGHPLARPPR